MKRIFKAVGLLLASLVLLFGVMGLFGFEKLWRFAGPADMGPVVWEGLKKGPKPNQALVCPKGLCNDADMDRESPVYAVDGTALKAALLKAVENERDLKRVDDDNAEFELRFVTYSPTMRFPDTTRVRIIPIDENSSTIALYAQAQIGVRDFEMNLKRVQRWLKWLEPLEAKIQ